MKSATVGSLHPDIIRAKSTPATKTNTFPTTEPYILFISLSNIERCDIAGFQQATSLSSTAFAHHANGFTTVHVALVSGGNALHQHRTVSLPHTIRLLSILLYPPDRESQGKSDSSSGRLQNSSLGAVIRHRIWPPAKNNAHVTRETPYNTGRCKRTTDAFHEEKTIICLGVFFKKCKNCCFSR